jgi:hypothetical protein
VHQNWRYLSFIRLTFCSPKLKIFKYPIANRTITNPNPRKKIFINFKSIFYLKHNLNNHKKLLLNSRLFPFLLLFGYSTIKFRYIWCFTKISLWEIAVLPFKLIKFTRWTSWNVLAMLEVKVFVPVDTKLNLMINY